MVPRFWAGDFLCVLCWYRKRSLRKETSIVFTHPEFGLSVKKIQRIDHEQQLIWVCGEHSASIDSQQLGAIPFSAVIGKVIAAIGRDGWRHV